MFLLLPGWSFAFFAAWGWKETADSGKCGGGGNLCLPVKVEDNGKKVKQESTSRMYAIFIYSSTSGLMQKSHYMENGQ